MTLWQRTSAEPSAVRLGTTEHVWCEILPITLRAGQIMYLQRGRDTAAAWHEPYDPAGHPSDIVRARVEAFLEPRSTRARGRSFDCLAIRMQRHGERTADLDLPGRAAINLPRAHLPGGAAYAAAGRGDMAARSGTLGPPEWVALRHILADALDHLALLLETDRAIVWALGPQWRAALAQRQRRPAGELRLAHAMAWTPSLSAGAANYVASNS